MIAHGRILYTPTVGAPTTALESRPDEGLTAMARLIMPRARGARGGFSKGQFGICARTGQRDPAVHAVESWYRQQPGAVAPLRRRSLRLHCALLTADPVCAAGWPVCCARPSRHGRLRHGARPAAPPRPLLFAALVPSSGARRPPAQPQEWLHRDGYGRPIYVAKARRENSGVVAQVSRLRPMTVPEMKALCAEVGLPYGKYEKIPQAHGNLHAIINLRKHAGQKNADLAGAAAAAIERVTGRAPTAAERASLAAQCREAQAAREAAEAEAEAEAKAEADEAPAEAGVQSALGEEAADGSGSDGDGGCGELGEHDGWGQPIADPLALIGKLKALRRRMVAEHEHDTSEGEEEAEEEEDEYGGGLCCFGPGETARCPACGEQSEVRIPALQTCTALRLPRAPSNPLAPRQAKLACVELDCAVRLAHITQEQLHTYMLQPSRTASCVRPTAHLMPLRPAAKS